MKPDTHQDASLKERIRVMEDMYERIRLVNLRLTVERDEARRDAKHLQELANAKDETIRDLRGKLKVTVRR